MEPEIMVALLAMLGTLGGSFVGVLASNKLTNFRIEQLEKKVDKHNSVVERMALAEASIKSAHRRLDEMRDEA